MPKMVQKQVDAWWLKGFTSAFDLLEQHVKDGHKLDAETLARLAAAEKRLSKILENRKLCNPDNPACVVMSVAEGILTALEHREMSVTQGFEKHELAHMTVQLGRINRIINHDARTKSLD
jgi:hypothetical protein